MPEMAEAMAVAVARGSGRVVAVAVGVSVGTVVGVSVGAGVEVGTGVDVGIAVDVGIGVEVGAVVAVGGEVGIAVAVGTMVEVGLMVGEAVGLGASVAVAVGTGVEVAVAVAVDVAVAVGGIGVDEGLAVGTAVDDAVAVAVAMGWGDAAGDALAGSAYQAHDHSTSPLTSASIFPSGPSNRSEDPSPGSQKTTEGWFAGVSSTKVNGPLTTAHFAGLSSEVSRLRSIVPFVNVKTNPASSSGQAFANAAASVAAGSASGRQLQAVTMTEPAALAGRAGVTNVRIRSGMMMQPRI
jgi:hypothetical protein